MALPHAETEVVALADGCACGSSRQVHGWDVDEWELDDADVARAVAAYTALLRGDTGPDADQILLDAGVPLDDLLLDAACGLPKVNRADVVELVAAASAVGEDGWPLPAMHAAPATPTGRRSARPRRAGNPPGPRPGSS